MEKLYNWLRILAGCSVGVFLGSCGYTFWHYKTHPELYAMNSAPWYTGLLFQGGVMAVTLLVAFLGMWLIRRKRKDG